uniref:Uncharacterized protein n=2 Tax=Anguilla anguilla TaxID=7936 RepID=A0A0E9R4R7_ANGAN
MQSLNSLKDDERMGPFRRSNQCSDRNSGELLFPGRLSIMFTITAIQFLLCWILL